MAQITIEEKDNLSYYLTGFAIANDKGNAYSSLDQSENYSEDVKIKSCFVINESSIENMYVKITDENGNILKFRIAADETFEEIFYKAVKIEIISNNTNYRAILRK